MPIGKNAIKRVSSNGYSKVQSSAPDMENSTVAKVQAEEAPKTEAPATTEVVKEAPKTTKKTTKKAPKAPKKQDFEHIAIGDALPYYLL